MKFSPNSNALKIYKSQLKSLTQIQFESAIGLLLVQPLQIRKYRIPKDLPPLSSELKEIIIGLLLGDAIARRYSRKGGSLLHFEQGSKNIEYGWHLYELFKEYIGKIPEVRSRFDKRTGKTYKRLQFATNTSYVFNEFYDLFYDPKLGKKIIPKNIAEYLTARSLAYWCQDDGAKDRSSFVLCTDSFSMEEVNILAEALRNNFNLDCTVRRNGIKAFRINIRANSIELFRTLVSPYFHSSMRYKIQPFSKIDDC
jgi:hypothetical protein